jgi:hypothetical protein
VATIAGLFYYGYSPFSLVAGAAMDGLGPRKVSPVGAARGGHRRLALRDGTTGARLRSTSPGAGGVFALVGAAYLATTNFPASRAATLIGATQMFGMAGGSAGQFLVGAARLIGVPWNAFWIVMGAAGLVVSVLLFWLIPPDHRNAPRDDGSRAPDARSSSCFRIRSRSSVASSRACSSFRPRSST